MLCNLLTFDPLFTDHAYADGLGPPLDVEDAAHDEVFARHQEILRWH